MSIAKFLRKPFSQNTVGRLLLHKCNSSLGLSVCYFIAQKMKFSIEDFFSKCDQVRRSIETRKDPKVWLSLSIASISLRHGLNLSSWNFKLNLAKFLGKSLSEPSSNQNSKILWKKRQQQLFSSRQEHLQENVSVISIRMLL